MLKIMDCWCGENGVEVCLMVIFDYKI